MGLVVKIDGHDGTGKTSLVAELAGRLKRSGLDVAQTSEFGTGVGDALDVRQVGADLAEIALDPACQFDTVERQAIFLAVALRQNRVVLPRLKASYDVVISDRSALTCYAYSVDVAAVWHELLDRVLAPAECVDHLFVLQLAATASFRREEREMGERERDAVELLGLEFQERVAAEYSRRVSLGTGVTLDASASLEDLAGLIERRIRADLHLS